MKLNYRQIESFVKTPDKAARVILVYGPDAGLAGERVKTMGKTVVADLSDPFNAVTLTTDKLTEDPALLADEAGAISMMGGDRLILIKDATDKLTVLLKTYLENPSNHALVLLQAGELGPRSTLRILCEKAKNAAAVPCYVEDERDLSRYIRETLQAENIGIDRDAVQWLAANISGDRGKVRSELEKLIVYKGAEKTPISINDVTQACGAAGAQDFDNLVYAVAGRNTAEALNAYTTLIAEGVNFVTILRTLQNHFRRLYLVKSRIAGGEDEDQALGKLTPPIFFKIMPAFKAQTRSWSLPALEQTLARLTTLEAQCKQTGMPVETLCAQAILSISATRAAA
ncbi:MAG: DNA polymerase III subunit delta [Alphaproteobacteria bacterium]|nr:DNA polymerase III subunit delta [Alphaproteobacteria bacterium]